MLGFKKKAAPPTDEDKDKDLDEDLDKEPDQEVEKPKAKAKAKVKEKDKAVDKEVEKAKDKEEDPADDAKATDASGKGGKLKGKLGLILGFAVLTLIAVSAGAGAGMYFASSLEQTFMARQKAESETEKTRPPVIIKYSGDRVLQKIEPIVTNLAAPPDTWIRLEAAIVFANGAIADPQATAAEIRQDILAYCRTLSLDQLQGPSALQHLREDLSERVSLRTNGAAKELVIETMVVQ
jgi:flagellar FliL protein